MTTTRAAARRLRPGHPFEISALNNLGVIYSRQNRPEEAEAALREALALRQETQGDDHPDTAAAHRTLANHLADQGQEQTAETHLREALAIQRRVLPSPHPSTSATLADLARFVSPAEAKSLLREALQQNEALYPSPHWRIAQVQASLARVLVAQGDPGAARSLLDASLPVLRDHYGPGSKEVEAFVAVREQL
jgi:Flp pilus assembly protein TadD